LGGFVLKEIRCQFIILARKDEPTPDYVRKYKLTPRKSVEIRRKSGVSSSFLPEKTNRHRITSATPDYVRKDKLTPDYVEKIN